VIAFGEKLMSPTSDRLQTALRFDASGLPVGSVGRAFDVAGFDKIGALAEFTFFAGVK
jgi:hypothetical protein